MTGSETVSIVVPCYNEEQTIGLLLSAIAAQTYPRAQMEVILADGNSSDSTRERIAQFQADHPGLNLRVIDNPKRIIPAGVNLAIQAASGNIIIRLDAHSVPEPTYVERCVAGLQAGLGENVGGLWLIEPGKAGWMAQSIAIAASHPLGAGDARYRYSTKAGEVDTVPFGAFKRSLFERIGYFDETLVTNEDYEFNTRIRANGGKIFFDPAIRTQYFARPTLGALARQYWRYGYWKWRMLKRFPETLRWRQALPPIFVLGVLLLLILSIWFVPARIVLLAGLSIYAALIIAASISHARRNKDNRLIIGIPAAITTMHFAWGSGFLWSFIHSGG
ncbi:MAG TPA: glycosyltransferase family 2 protein [Bellilinea sp.]|nr:glycosyltransferase family 2 protein [Bellilinea sp.]